MSSITPQKSHSGQKNNSFSPVILQQSSPITSPQINLTGPPRIAKDLAADLHNNIQKWNDWHVKGANIVKRIASDKDSEPTRYTLRLEENLNELYNVVQSLETCVKCFESLNKQIVALDKMTSDSNPMFFSMTCEEMKGIVGDIVEAYLKEYEVKKLVLENIAHTKDVHQAMFFALAWTYQPKISSCVNMKLEMLLIETGHRKIN